MPNRHAESDIQQSIVKHLRAKGFFPVAVPNGSFLSGSHRQRAMRMAFMKKEGLHPGFPDLSVYGPEGKVAHIEVKAPKKYQKPPQKASQQVLEELGHVYAVCRSTDDVDAALAEWGWVEVTCG